MKLGIFQKDTHIYLLFIKWEVNNFPHNLQENR